MTQEEIAREAHKMILSFWEKDFDMHVLVDGVTITQTGRKLAWKDAKECAIIAVEKIIACMPNYPHEEKSELPLTDAISFWVQVKQQLEKL